MIYYIIYIFLIHKEFKAFISPSKNEKNPSDPSFKFCWKTHDLNKTNVSNTLDVHVRCSSFTRQQHFILLLCNINSSILNYDIIIS